MTTAYCPACDHKVYAHAVKSRYSSADPKSVCKGALDCTCSWARRDILNGRVQHALMASKESDI